MPISMTCQCGKALRLKDEWVGKKAKCPQCGATFIVPAQGNAPVAMAKTVAAPSAAGAAAWAPRSRPQQEAGVGSRIHLSGWMILWLSLVVLVPLAIYIIKIGPVAAQHKWDAMEGEADSAVNSVISRAIQSHLSK